MLVIAAPKRGMCQGVSFLAAMVLFEGWGSLIFHGQARHLSDLIFNYYKPFLKYAFNWGPIFEAWFGWPIIRTAPRYYSFFLPPLGCPRRDGH